MKEIAPIVCTAILITACLLSCTDKLDTISLSESGDLSVSLKSPTGDPVSGAKIDLYDSEGLMLYQRKLTNEDGVGDFGKYNAGTYLLRIQAEAGPSIFDFTQLTQVVSGIDKSITLNLSEYTVNLQVNVYGSSSYELLKFSGYSIALLPISKLDDLVDEEMLYGQIEAYGLSAPLNSGQAVLEKIPIGEYYCAIVSPESLVLDASLISLHQYEDDVINKYVDEVALNLRRKVFTISSVKNIFNSQNIVHNYATIQFKANAEFVLTLKNGEKVNGYYSHYTYSSGESSLDFNWSGSSQWSTAIYGTDDDKITLSTYDYNAYEDVVITLQ